jgi:hypothetical protein
MNSRVILACAAITLLTHSALAQVHGQGRTLEQRIEQTRWETVRGANFIPSYSANTYEMWRNYDHDTFDRELGLAEAVGYNSIRLWLNYAAYEELGSKMVDEVEDAVSLATRHHLRAVIVLFDSCGVRSRRDTQWLPAPEAYARLQASPRFTAEQKTFMRHLFANYVHGFGAYTMVPIASDSPIMALLYQKWLPTPGNDRLGPEWYPKLEIYVDSVIARLRNNPTVLLWDLMNEPEWASEGPLSSTEIITPEMKLVRDAFLRHFREHIKQNFPGEIVSIGWADLTNAESYEDLADVVTFHVYGGAERIQSEIEKAEAFGKRSGKKVLITETLANWDFGSPDFGSLASDEQQLAHYKRVLPVLSKSPIGWISWGLVISNDFDPFTDVFYPDGHPRPAALFLQETLKAAQTPK